MVGHMHQPLRLVLLAAGGSSRMRGGDKLLEEIDGEPLLRRQACALIAADLGSVAVTLPPDRPARTEALAGLPLSLLTITDAADGMSASLRAAAAWSEGHGMLVVPADMPELTAKDFQAVVTGFDGRRPTRATSAEGTPGHPVIFPASLLPAFAALSGDEGAKPVLKLHNPRLVPLPGDRAITDLDTPEAWAAWRQSRASLL